MIAAQRIDDEPDRPRPPPFQYFTASSHSCCGGAGSWRASGGMAPRHPESGRRKSKLLPPIMASTGRRLSPTAARLMSSSSRNAGAFCCAYAAIDRPPMCAPNIAMAQRRAARRPRPAAATEPAGREIRHRHHQRQRVAGRERLLEEQVEDQVRTERDGQRPRAHARSCRHSHDEPERRRRPAHDCRERPCGPGATKA